MAFGSRIDCASCCCGSGVAAGAGTAAPRAGKAGAPIAAFATASPPKAGAAPRAGAGAAAAGAAPPPPRPPPPPPRGGAEIALRSGPNREPFPFTRWQLRQLALLLSKMVLPRTASPGGSAVLGACANSMEPKAQSAARTSEGTENVLIRFATFMEGVRILARHDKDEKSRSDRPSWPGGAIARICSLTDTAGRFPHRCGGEWNPGPSRKSGWLPERAWRRTSIYRNRSLNCGTFFPVHVRR